MTNALKEMQRDNAHIMQALHEACRFDFCKPYVATKIYGKYTENKIRKMMAETFENDTPITTSTHRIVILTKCEDSWLYNRWHLVEILGTRIDISTRCPNNYGCAFDNFYTQSRFHEVRKSDTCQTIIVAQHYNNLCRTKARTYDMYRRMELLEIRNNRTWDSDKQYIGALIVKGENRGKETIYTSGYPKSLDSIIDKSGYLLQNRHADLRQRLKEDKANKAKAIADSTDFSEHLATLTTLVQSKKIILTETFKNCTTCEEYKEFERAFSYCNGFVDIIGDFERYRSDVNSNGFASVDEEERRYNSLMTKLTK